MKAIILLALVACAVAAEVSILRNDQAINEDGTYSFVYATDDGTHHEVTGDAIQTKGTFKFVSPEGTPVQVSYVADENGFQPVGDHLPVDHPVPEQIARAIEYIRAHPPKE